MLEIINLSLPLEAALPGNEEIVYRQLLKGIGLKASQLKSYYLKKRAIDARKKHELKFIASFVFETSIPEEKLLMSNGNIRPFQEDGYYADRLSDHKLAKINAHYHARPIIIGAGCAGLFAALCLARAGLRPLIFERGQSSKRRTADIDAFNASGILNPQSNIQFGLGGAGSFSDGKLTTNTSSPYHRFILKSLVEAGAPEEILYLSKPHIGSDILPCVVETLVEHITSYGGEFHFGACLKQIGCKEGSDQEFDVEIDFEQEHRSQTYRCSKLILACGHSARDVFELLHEHKVFLERKSFSVGVRIEHLQAEVNRAQYGNFADHPALGAADYKLVHHLPQGKSAYSFCMCPGGTVVAATSELGGVCTNGMSEFSRDAQNANAGYLVSVEPKELEGSSVLAGVELQRQCERKAFELGGGSYRAPAQRVGDFLKHRASTEGGCVIPSYPRSVTWGSIDAALPNQVVETLRACLIPLSKKLSCFANEDAVLTGVETRSSSPIRIVRDKISCQSLSHPGIIPCGEGAGYAGGIMSAAADGIRCAEACITHLLSCSEQ